MTIEQAKEILKTAPRSSAERVVYMRALMLVAGSFTRRPL